jgi:hypothetical protein
MAITVDPVGQFTVKRRYIVNATGIITVSYLDLRTAGGVIVTSGNTCKTVMMAQKLNRVKIWCNPFTSSTAGYANVVSMTLIWGPVATNTYYGAARSQITAMSMGPERPMFIDSRPPAKSQAAGWNQDDTSRVFAVWGVTSNGTIAAGLPAGTVIEVDITYRHSDGSLAGTTYTSAAAPAVGTFTYPPLDGSGSKLCIAQGVQGSL